VARDGRGDALARTRDLTSLRAAPHTVAS
jgi:hypothetical protein